VSQKRIVVAIIVESIHGIKTPLPLPKPYTLVVLAGVLVAREILFRHVGHVAAEIGSTAVSGDACDAIASGFAFIGVVGTLMEAFKVRLLNGSVVILVADEKPLYVSTGGGFYTVEDLTAGERPHLQVDPDGSIKPIIDWNKAVELAAAKHWTMCKIQR
jgi:hypothetical protein